MKTGFRLYLESYSANDAGRVQMVSVKVNNRTFGAGHCSVFVGETPVEVVAVSVREAATYKTILPRDEAAAWLVRVGCPISKAAELMEEAHLRKTETRAKLNGA
jgi:hypothetical protein